MMHLDGVIAKLQEERRKYGNIPVVIHAPLEYGNETAARPRPIEDIATFSTLYSRAVWLSTEPTE